MQNERIFKRRKELGMTQQALATKVGVSKATVSQWESGLFVPGGSNLLALAKCLNVTPDWLTFGNDNGVTSIAGRGLRKQPDAHTNIIPANIGSSQVPVLSYVQAGAWCEASEVSSIEGGVEYVFSDAADTSSLFALYIKGNSMEPDFKEGDLIIVDTQLAAAPGDFVVAKNGSEESTFKKYRPRGYDENGKEYFELHPLNDDYPVMRSDITPIKIIGVMIEHRRFRRNTSTR